MNLDKQAKRKQIKHCQQALQDCHHLLVIKYAGLSVQELETLRDLITENGGYLKIFKNRLMQQALKSSEYSDLQKYLTGQNAFIWTPEEQPMLLKKIYQFTKKQPKIKIHAGLHNKQLLAPQAMWEMVSLPTKPELIAMLLGLLLSPLQQLLATIKLYSEKKAE